MSSLIYGSRSVSKRAPWYIHHSCIKILAVDDREKSELHGRFDSQCGLTSFAGGLNSQKKTKSTYAIGSLLRFLTRRRVVELETGSTSNFAIW